PLREILEDFLDHRLVLLGPVGLGLVADYDGHRGTSSLGSSTSRPEGWTARGEQIHRGVLDLLNHRWLRKARQRLSRSLRGLGWDATTAHRACRDVRSGGAQPSLRSRWFEAQ